MALLVLAMEVSPARADARSRRVEAVLTASERELTRGNVRAAERRLVRALSRDAEDARLVLRFAELLLPLAGTFDATHLPALEQHADSLFAALTRVAADTRAPQLGAEDGRRLALHAAWAAALRRDPERAFSEVLEGGRLQDGLTLACLRQLAALFVRRGELALAERALAMARQYVPQDRALGAELGHVLLARGEPERALTLFAERHAIDPHDLETRRDFAYGLASVGRSAEAHALLMAARERCEQAPDCALEAARIALEAGRTAAAMEHAESRLRRDSRDLEALYVIADAHTRGGALAAARATYERILQVSPHSVRAKQALAQLPASSNPPEP